MRTRRPFHTWLYAILATVMLITIETGTFTGAAQTLAAGSGASSKPYAGVTLNFIGEATTQTDVLKKLVPEFTKSTGIKVNIEEAPYDNVVQKELLDFATHKGFYDVESMPYEYLGTYVDKGYIQPITQYLSNRQLTPTNFDTGDIIKKLWQAASNWKGTYYGFPSESPAMMLFYRKDLFTNKAEQSAFLKRYHYKLAVPKTWAQYRDTVAFFTRKKGQALAGKRLSHDFYGVAIAAKRHLATACEWLNYAWSFGGGIFNNKGYLIDNSPANVKALTYWVGLTRYAPPGYTTYTWDEVTSAFQQGTVAEAITWGDTAAAVEDPSQSKVTGKMGFADIPAVRPGGKVVAHYGGWSYVINKDSAHKEAAYLFMRWALDKNTQLQLARLGGLPARSSTFHDSALSKRFAYWNQEYRSLSISTSRPRIPQWGELASAMELTLSQALAHEMNPKAALNSMQDQMSKALKGALPVKYQ